MRVIIYLHLRTKKKNSEKRAFGILDEHVHAYESFGRIS